MRCPWPPSSPSPSRGIRTSPSSISRDLSACGPLVLLHGGGSAIEITFSKVLPVFARSRMVIAVEEQRHGRTTDRDAPVTFESSADDVAACLKYLEIDTADVLGFSNGASIALQIAIRHPQLVRKLVLASSITRRDGAQQSFWEFIGRADFSSMPQPLNDALLRVNPDPAHACSSCPADTATISVKRSWPSTTPSFPSPPPD